MANTLIVLLKKNVNAVCSKTVNVFENSLATTDNEFVTNELVNQYKPDFAFVGHRQTVQTLIRGVRSRSSLLLRSSTPTFDYLP